MRSLYGMLVAGAIALAGLALYDKRINGETFALDPTVTLSTENWKGVLFTAPSVAEIKTLIAHSGGQQPIEGKCKPLSILWLGNSQLHFINQYAQGDHVAPYWLRQAAPCPDTTVPLGVSLPNANLQEHYILASYVTTRLPIRLIILELCFDDMREDGLREEFHDFLDISDRERLARNPVGRDVVQSADEQ